MQKYEFHGSFHSEKNGKFLKLEVANWILTRVPLIKFLGWSKKCSKLSSAKFNFAHFRVLLFTMTVFQIHIRLILEFNISTFSAALDFFSNFVVFKILSIIFFQFIGVDYQFFFWNPTDFVFFRAQVHNEKNRILLQPPPQKSQILNANISAGTSNALLRVFFNFQFHLNLFPPQKKNNFASYSFCGNPYTMKFIFRSPSLICE